ncbi:MAG: arginase [Kiloniellales bacterium]|nr:arginase [Kiloniellales bacterium]
MKDPKQTVTLIGAPTDIGAGHRGASMGPEALRVAGLEPALRRLGFPVKDAGNLVGPPNPNLPPENGYRHLAETAAWCRSLEAAFSAALQAETLPILLGGDHCLAIGSIAAVAKHCAEQDKPLSVLWFDAHADFNTPATSPSGNIHGMPVAILCGQGPAALTGLGAGAPILDAAQIVQIGIRSVDHVEKLAVVGSGMTVYDMRIIDERGMHAVMAETLEAVQKRGGHLHVSFDVDFLDPAIAPGVGTTVLGGPTYREAQLAMEMIHDCGLMASLDIMELNPAFDIRNQTADMVVELVASLFGEQILSRHKTSFD